MKGLILLILLIPSITFGQRVNTTKHGGQRNIFNDAIKRYLTHISNDKQMYYDTIFIWKEDIITDSLNKRIGKIFIKTMDGQEITAKIDRDTSFILHQISPLNFDKGNFYISIIPFITSKENGELLLANPGGYQVFYSFESQQKNFNFLKTVSNAF